MKNTVLVIFLWCLGMVHLSAQSVDVRFEGVTGPCERNLYCVSLQVRSMDGADYLGAASIRFSYNPEAITFEGNNRTGVTVGEYHTRNFDNDPSTLDGGCNILGGGAFYHPHSFEGRPTGDFLLTLFLANNNGGNICPSIDGEWKEVSQVCFEVLDNLQDPNFRIEGNHTRFNDITNDPANKYLNGDFNELHTSYKALCGKKGIKLNPRILLQGAWKDTNEDGLMEDDLRANGWIPTTEPYGDLLNFKHIGGETIDPIVLEETNHNAIVDWVLVELREAANSESIIATRAGLLQRDGDIVEVDGVSPLEFPDVETEHYYVSVRHRNHLGVMTANSHLLTNVPIVIDFTTGLLPTYGSNAQCLQGDGACTMWMGNVNGDSRIIFQGAENDANEIFFCILKDIESNGEIGFIQTGYLMEDLNMDGQAIYQGAGNEANHLFFSIMNHPDNPNQRMNHIINEQLP